MRRSKRRHMTMLETLIALGLAMIILSTLMFYYRQVDAINGQVEKIQEESFRMRYVENRLAAILPQAVSETDGKKDFFFFTTASSPSVGPAGTLIFTFDNGIKLDKAFSNHVLGRLFLDAEGNLNLFIWPSPSRWAEGAHPPVKKEILLKGVKDLKFNFFVAPDRKWGLEKKNSDVPKEKKGKNPESPKEDTEAIKPPEGQWISAWSSDYKQLPALVKIEITKDHGEAQIFVFPLPNSQRQVVYTQ